MRYVIQLVRWLLRFMDKSSEDRVDAYSAQSAFFYHYGIYSLCDVAAYFAPVHADDKRRRYDLVEGDLSGRFPCVPGNVSRICVYKIHRIALWNGDHSSLGVQQGHDVCIQRTE